MKSPSEEVCASKIIRLIERWPIQFLQRQAVAAINKRTRVNLPPFLCQFSAVTPGYTVSIRKKKISS